MPVDQYGIEHTYSINNTVTPLLARWLLKRHPDMRIETRKSLFDEPIVHPVAFRVLMRQELFKIDLASKLHTGNKRCLLMTIEETSGFVHGLLDLGLLVEDENGLLFSPPRRVVGFPFPFVAEWKTHPFCFVLFCLLLRPPICEWVSRWFSVWFFNPANHRRNSGND